MVKLTQILKIFNKLNNVYCPIIIADCDRGQYSKLTFMISSNKRPNDDNQLFPEDKASFPENAISGYLIRSLRLS